MSDIIRKEENIELELSDNTLLSSLFGVNDANLTIIEKINDVKRIIDLFFLHHLLNSELIQLVECSWLQPSKIYLGIFS